MSETISRCESEGVCLPDLAESSPGQPQGDANDEVKLPVAASESHLTLDSESPNQV
jgi:hypothetical protein